ncbi:MAG: hypothetical protein K0R08_2205 [Solimicrobium sp.]|jgi:hypothetical protein|nr:hypothetical protein [Solimicrobium sp.]
MKGYLTNNDVVNKKTRPVGGAFLVDLIGPVVTGLNTILEGYICSSSINRQATPLALTETK